MTISVLIIIVLLAAALFAVGPSKAFRLFNWSSWARQDALSGKEVCPKDTVCVWNYGAVCDGKADDTLSIEAAMAVAQNLHEPLKFPNGICKTRGPKL